MGSGASSSEAVERKKSAAAYKAKLTKYDLDSNGTLNRDELRRICDDYLAVETAAETAHGKDGVVVMLSDTDLDTIMTVGGRRAVAEITRDELPAALAALEGLRLKRAHAHGLFMKYDVDNNGEMPASELTALLTEVTRRSAEHGGGRAYSKAVRSEWRGALDWRGPARSCARQMVCDRNGHRTDCNGDGGGVAAGHRRLHHHRC